MVGVTGFPWDIVDSSFYPDATALQAAEEDVTDPWTTSDVVTQSFHGRFLSGGKNTWKTTIATPLDGDFSLSLTMPRGALDDVTTFSPDGRTVLAKGLWASPTQKKIAMTICGQRSVFLRVTEKGLPGRFSLQVTHD